MPSNVNVGAADFSLNLDLKGLKKNLKKSEKLFDKFFKSVNKSFKKLQKQSNKDFFSRIETSIKTISKKEIKIKVNTAALDKFSNKAESAINGVISDANKIGNALSQEFVRAETTAVNAANKIENQFNQINADKLKSSFRSTFAKVEGLAKSAASSIKSAFKGLDPGSKLVGGFKSSFSKIESMAKATGKAIGSALKTTAKVGIAGAGAGVGGVAIVAKLGDSLDAITKKLQLATDMQEKDLQKLQKLIVDVYRNNFTDSLADAANKLGIVNALLAAQGKDISKNTVKWQGLVEGIQTITDVEFWDADFFETTRAAVALMGEFPKEMKNIDDVFDFLAVGFKEGMDINKDFLDTISEYSPHFKEAGFKAKEMFSLIKTGLGGVGVGADQVGDFIKEFVNTFDELKDEDKVKGLIELFGKDKAKEILSSKDVNEVFSTLLVGVQKTSDKIKRLRLGKLFFGTKFEDVIKARDELTAFNKTLENNAGFIEKLRKQYDTFGNAVSGIWREVITGLSLLGSALGAETGKGGLVALKEGIRGLFEAIQPKVIELFKKFIEFITKALPKIESFVKKFDFEKSIKSVSKSVKSFIDPFKKFGKILSDIFKQVKESKSFQILIENIKSIFQIIKNFAPVVLPVLNLVFTAAGLTLQQLLKLIEFFSGKSKTGAVITGTVFAGLVAWLAKAGFSVKELSSLLRTLLLPIKALFKLLKSPILFFTDLKVNFDNFITALLKMWNQAKNLFKTTVMPWFLTVVIPWFKKVAWPKISTFIFGAVKSLWARIALLFVEGGLILVSIKNIWDTIMVILGEKTNTALNQWIDDNGKPIVVEFIDWAADEILKKISNVLSQIKNDFFGFIKNLGELDPGGEFKSKIKPDAITGASRRPSFSANNQLGGFANTPLNAISKPMGKPTIINNIHITGNHFPKNMDPREVERVLVKATVRQMTKRGK
ncbi:MAG: phage tail tape measure protein [Candidatus Heimdallarchaeaceae archaeon]